MRWFFAHLDEKDNLLEIFRKFSKILKNFIRKLLKMHYFNIFFKKFNKPCVNLLCVWTKKTMYWKFWENFRKFWKSFFGKLIKCIILAYFSKSLTNHVLIFWAFGRKNNLQKIFEKIFKNFLRKLWKMHYFIIFS